MFLKTDCISPKKTHSSCYRDCGWSVELPFFRLPMCTGDGYLSMLVCVCMFAFICDLYRSRATARRKCLTQGDDMNNSASSAESVQSVGACSQSVRPIGSAFRITCLPRQSVDGDGDGGTRRPTKAHGVEPICRSRLPPGTD